MLSDQSYSLSRGKKWLTCYRYRMGLAARVVNPLDLGSACRPVPGTSGKIDGRKPPIIPAAVFCS